MTNTIKTTHRRPVLSRVGSLAISALMALTFVTSTAQAGERIVLRFAGEEITQKEGLRDIDLVAMMKQQYTNVNLAHYQLRQVLVAAKSPRRDAKVWLKLGEFETGRTAVANSDNFDSDEVPTYTRHELAPVNPLNTPKPWILKVRGRTKLQRAVLVLDDCSKGECVFQREATDRDLRLGEGGVLRLDRETHTIDLRRELGRAYGGIDLKHAKLLSIDLTVKARDPDFSVARLKSGAADSRVLQIRGGVDNFRNNAPQTWQTERLELRQEDAGGNPWVLEFKRGTIKVQKISIKTIDRAFWRPNGQSTSPVAAASDGSATTNSKTAACTAENCAKGPKVTSRATGARSCYASSDGRRIDRRDGAMVSWREGCKDGSCMQREESCYESRTCNCANGSGRCKEVSSCVNGVGCVHGYTTTKMHCRSGIFNM